jgi:hypothetical protein
MSAPEINVEIGVEVTAALAMFYSSKWITWESLCSAINCVESDFVNQRTVEYSPGCVTSKRSVVIQNIISQDLTTKLPPIYCIIYFKCTTVPRVKRFKSFGHAKWKFRHRNLQRPWHGTWEVEFVVCTHRNDGSVLLHRKRSSYRFARSYTNGNYAHPHHTVLANIGQIEYSLLRYAAV